MPSLFQSGGGRRILRDLEIVNAKIRSHEDRATKHSQKIANDLDESVLPTNKYLRLAIPKAELYERRMSAQSASRCYQCAFRLSDN